MSCVNLTGTFNVIRLASEIMAATEPIGAEGQRERERVANAV